MPSMPVAGAKLRRLAVVGLALGLSVATSGASAQTPPPGRPATPPEVMEPPAESPVPRGDPGTGDAEPKEPLSKELKEGEGVLEPPRGVDPEIRKPIPDEFESKTPVIPPPGEPGGRQDVQPK